MTVSTAVVIPAAGSGSRMGQTTPKQYILLHGLPILLHTINAFIRHPAIQQIIVVVPEAFLEATANLVKEHHSADSRLVLVKGGRRRQDSVLAGLHCLAPDMDIVLVHDGARPFVRADLIDRCIESANLHGTAIAAIPVKDTLKRQSADCTVEATINRERLWQAQTPQAAQVPLLRKAFAENADRDVTDESMLFEQAGIAVHIVEGSETNIKITHPEDLVLAEKLHPRKPDCGIRIGHGFDAHRLVEGRELVLGGVAVPYHLGLAGHSDADVVTHALCDALLGAVGEGDIGRHFPDSSAAYAGIRSILLLDRVVELLHNKQFLIGNADLTIVCQAPKLAPHIPQMKTILAASCGISESSINIKATTTEHMGYTGRSEGISCHAVALLQPLGNVQS